MQSTGILKISWLFLVLVFADQTVGKKYYLHLNKLNWHGAFQACAVYNLQLATVNSQIEQDDLEILVEAAGKQEESIWISGTDLARDNTYSWMSTGKPLSYTHWSPGEPSEGGNEHCVHLSPVPEGTISWNNQPCNHEFYYICEDKTDNNYSKNVNVNLTF